LTNGVISEDDPETPLNIPVQQLDTASVLSGVNQQLDYFGGEGANSDVPGGERLRRMRWVHQMSEYYSFEALARMSEEEMDKALSTWSTTSQSTLSLPQHEGGAQLVAGTSRQGRIFLIGSGPGHPGLLTLAAHHVLKSATVILSDKLVPAEILALIPKTTDLFIAKKFPGNNEGAQNELMVRALEAARKGEIVVRLKQGDPFVYGRGGEEVLYFRENGYECTVIPGVTSSIAGPEMFNIPVTQRGVSESMILCTGVGRQGKSVNLPGYIKSRSLVVLMGVARINQIVSTLVDDQSEGRDGAKYPPYLPIALIERASSPDQRLITSTLANIESAIKSVEERPPGMMLIGWSVLALEGKGRIDILDKKEQGDEEEVVKEWLGGVRWKIREGLDWGWGEFLGDLGRV
jgi:uroporphyrin-III C-methyltransferase